MSLLNIITNLGLTEKEGQVYLACLELGSSPVSEIARRAGINRVTTYDVLSHLMKKGMVSSTDKGSMKFFDAIDPEKIAAEFRRRELDFRHALPDFKRLKGEAIHPRVRYFEGLDGIKAIYEDTLTSSTDILNYSNSRAIRDHWANYDAEYVQKRVRNKIFLRGISPDDEHGSWVRSQDHVSHREIRLVPSKEFTFTNEINIYDDKVAIISFTDVPLIGMIIESLQVANTQRDIFTMAWNFAGKYGKKKA